MAFWLHVEMALNLQGLVVCGHVWQGGGQIDMSRNRCKYGVTYQYSSSKRFNCVSEQLCDANWYDEKC